jgi:hypothetical protein
MESKDSHHMNGREVAALFGREELLVEEARLAELKAELEAHEANKDLDWETYEAEHTRLREEVRLQDEKVRASGRDWAKKRAS